MTMSGRFKPLLAAAITASLAACGGGGSSGSPSPVPTPVVRFIYASVPGSNAVLLFNGNANGNVAPAQVLSGSQTQLDTPAGLALNSLGTLYVVDSPTGNAGGSITIYPGFTGGNIAPQTFIRGSLTQLRGPFGIAVDASGTMFVTNSSARNGGAVDSIVAFPASASANVYPAQWIQGASTGLSQPSGIALDSSGRIWVANSGNNTVTAYPQTPTTTSPANVVPAITLSGSATKLNAPVGLAFDASGRLWVSNSGNDTIEIFSGSGGGNQAPLFTLGGSTTKLGSPQLIAFDPFADLDVANAGANSVEVFAPLPFPLPGSGNIAPAINLAGANTLLGSPLGVAAK
jgi:sugar lactone lactonase YvrE